jgi:SAM-dependent methyltransferase
MLINTVAQAFSLYAEDYDILCTLCFVNEPGMVIAEAKRVLKNGGGLILGIINRESPWGKLYQAKKAEGHPIYQHARFYNINEVETLLHDSELTVDAYSSTLCQPPSDAPHEEGCA